MKHTILGSSGFIGTSLKAYLDEHSLEYYLPKKDHSFSKKENLGHVFYCIGLTADFRSKPMETVKAHVCKLMEVLENSTFESFLYLSSARVYSGSDSGEEQAVLSVDPNNFSDLYNISKLMGESICLSIPNEKIRIARLSNVIGNDFNSDNFLFSLIKEAVDKQSITLQVPPNSEKDYIAIDDVVKVLVMIATIGKQRMYNVSSGNSISNQLIVDEIKKNIGCKVEFKDPKNSLSFPDISNARIKKEFSFEAKNILPQIKSLIEIYKRKKHDIN